MQRLTSELPLTPEQLEGVFDSLDDDQNGYLTLEEFTGGFSKYNWLTFVRSVCAALVACKFSANLIFKFDHLNCMFYSVTYLNALVS